MQLNLPQYNHNIRKNEELLEIFCLVRRKWYLLTPEEWVRQNLAVHLERYVGYPLARIAFEKELEVNGKRMRPDIVLYNPQWEVDGIIECKAPYIELDQKVLDQIGRYDRILQARWVGISNGLQHLFYNPESGWRQEWPML
jgi:hypothetical protein